MKKITLQDVDGLEKHDRISITYLNKDEVTSNTSYASNLRNIIKEKSKSGLKGY